MSDADIGLTSKFKIKSGVSFVALAEVTSINGIKISRDSVETTHLNSPNGYREFRGGLKTAEPVSIGLNYIPSGDDETALLAAMEADGGEYQVEFPDGSTWTFAGFCSEFEIGELTAEGKMEAAATFTPGGKPTKAEAEA